MKTYRLEFNEKQQHFHLDNYSHDENTNGWFTIFDHCTDDEFKIYEAYVNRIDKKKFTKEYLIKSAFELKKFISNLHEYNIEITRQ